MFALYYTYNPRYAGPSAFSFLESSVSDFISSFFKGLEINQLFAQSHDFDMKVKQPEVVVSDLAAIAITAVHFCLDETKLCFEQMDGVGYDQVSGPVRMVTVILPEFEGELSETGYFSSPVVNMYVRSKNIPIPKAWLRQHPQFWAQYYLMSQTSEWSDVLISRWILAYPEHFKDAYALYLQSVWFEMTLWENQCLIPFKNTINMIFKTTVKELEFRRIVPGSKCRILFKCGLKEMEDQYAYIPDEYNLRFMELRFGDVRPRSKVLLNNYNSVPYVGLVIEDVSYKTSRASLQRMFFSLSMNGVRRLMNLPAVFQGFSGPGCNIQSCLFDTMSVSFYYPQPGIGLIPFKEKDWFRLFDDTFSDNILEGYQIKGYDLGMWYDRSDRSPQLNKIEGSDYLYGPNYFRTATGPGICCRSDGTGAAWNFDPSQAGMNDDACEIT